MQTTRLWDLSKGLSLLYLAEIHYLSETTIIQQKAKKTHFVLLFPFLFISLQHRLLAQRWEKGR